jgi:hypothetical protein
VAIRQTGPSRQETRLTQTGTPKPNALIVRRKPGGTRKFVQETAPTRELLFSREDIVGYHQSMRCKEFLGCSVALLLGTVLTFVLFGSDIFFF